MKRFPILIAFILIAAGSARAELWCGSGPGAPLDHPCIADNALYDRVFDQYALELGTWPKIPGVKSVGYGISQRGFYPEIEVFVKDSATVAVVRPKIPASVGGITVAVVPIPHATVGIASPSKCPEQPEDYVSALRESSKDWNNIPGVFGSGPRCRPGCCRYDRIEVWVQVPFLESAKAKIPGEFDGYPVDVVPLKWPFSN